MSDLLILKDELKLKTANLSKRDNHMFGPHVVALCDQSFSASNALHLAVLQWFGWRSLLGGPMF